VLIVDGTDCPIERPTTKQMRLRYFSGRKKDNQYSKYNLKYTIAIHIATGKICAVIGPDPGAFADLYSLEISGMYAYLESWSPFEIILADKGYQGDDHCLTPWKGPNLTPEQDAFNEVLASVRQLVECVLKRVKDFRALGAAGRFRCSPEKHFMVFNVACNIANIAFERNPVWLDTNWYLK